MLSELLLLACGLILGVQGDTREVGVTDSAVCTIDITELDKSGWHKNFEQGKITDDCKTYHFAETPGTFDKHPKEGQELPPHLDLKGDVRRMGYMLIMQVPGMTEGRVKINWGNGETTIQGQHKVHVQFKSEGKQGYHYMTMICW